MDLKPDTQTPLSHVLAGKARGSSTLTVPPDITVAMAVEVLNENQVGSVLVMDGARLVGIFTERDILRRVVGERRDPATTKVSDVMTRDLVVMRPTSSVVDGNIVLGVVSQGDLNHWLVRNREGQIQDLVDYVTGRYPA